MPKIGPPRLPPPPEPLPTPNPPPVALPRPFAFDNWYWHVGGDLTKAYSLALGDYVPSSDSTFLVWKAAGNRPSTTDSEANLGGTIAAIGAPRPIAANVLAAYQSAKASAVDLTQFRIEFNHENRVRVLEARPQVTAQQFLNAIANLL